MKRTSLLIIAGVVALMAGVCAQGNLPQPVQAAIQDLSQRLNVPAEQITVVTMERVTWPDTSLGNPQPGQVYAQVVTAGSRVLLEAGGQQYEYHTDMGATITLVEPVVGSGPLPPATGEDDPVLQRLSLIRQAKSHLAQRLRIDRAGIVLVGVEQVTWPDSSLGVPGQPATHVETPGYRLVFEADEGRYSYHTDMADRIVAADGVQPVEAAVPVETPPEPPPPVTGAIADLARRLGIGAADVEVASVEAVEWPDGSLGLPEPGMMYTQAIVPGYRIVLAAQGRSFEYHSATGAAVKFAGVRYPEDAAISVLSLVRAEPTDGNNFFHLQRIEPHVEVGRIEARFVSTFATTPDGLDIAVVKRTSRSSHDLGHLQADGSVTRLDGAFDFFGVAWSPLGNRLACWARPMVDKQAGLRLLSKPWGEPRELALPDLPPGSFRPGSLVWTNDGLAITVYPAGGDAPQSFFWDGQAMQPLGAYEVLGWIPRTSSLLAIRATPEGDAELVTLPPGRGQTATLLTATAIPAAAAPADERYVLAVSQVGGNVRVLRVDWGGRAEEVLALPGATELSLHISPVGGVATVGYLLGDLAKSDVLQVGAAQPPVTSIVQPGPAIPVAD